MNPRWYQTEAVEAAWHYLCTEQGSPLIVIPTGSGKSLLAGMLARKATAHAGRVIVLAHRKELLQQNAEKIRSVGLDVGIYSAGLSSRDTDHDVICAGIQSIYKKSSELGARHLVVIDEAHLVGEEGMYRDFLTELRSINPKLRVVGMTATPFRTGEGKVCGPNRLFQSICYTVPIKRLIEEGYLSNLTTLSAETSYDTSGLHIRGGEFIQSEMATLFDDKGKIEAACREIVEKTKGRKSVLIFCASVFHAAKVSEAMEFLSSQECGLVVGDTPPLERAALLRRFKSGELRFLCNCDVLTTGFDSPNIDAIAILRATMSSGLMAQMCGRGLRIADGKSNCLILDFGENISRHGPLDASDYGMKATQRRGAAGDAPTKECPNCQERSAIQARECLCGFAFPFERDVARHGTNASGDAILESEVVKTRWVVEEVHLSRHKKKNGEPGDPDTLRVDYLCQPEDGTGNLTAKTISEWICLEHEGFTQRKALKWWQERSKAEVSGIDDAISLFRRGALATPTHITTIPKDKFTRVIGYELDPIPEEWRDEEDAEDLDFAEQEMPF